MSGATAGLVRGETSTKRVIPLVSSSDICFALLDLNCETCETCPDSGATAGLVGGETSTGRVTTPSPDICFFIRYLCDICDCCDIYMTCLLSSEGGDLNWEGHHPLVSKSDICGICDVCDICDIFLHCETSTVRVTTPSPLPCPSIDICASLVIQLLLSSSCRATEATAVFLLMPALVFVLQKHKQFEVHCDRVTQR